jgi:uncharacterized membrane protein
MGKASDFFSAARQEEILSAIKLAEKATSGEIRVHVETTFTGDVLDRAAWIFNKLGMNKTELRNGVLFYLATERRAFAIIGDAGINSKVGPDFWNSTKDIVEKYFREGQFAEGLSAGILMAGEQLRTHFPCMSSDVNELPNDISFDNPK